MSTFDNHYSKKHNRCNLCLFKWIHGQTEFASLMLYAYLFWYGFIMFIFGAKNMPSNGWETALVLATFVFFALNAAAYHPPLFGPKGYIHNYFKMIRFYIIPFCVSSISVACNASKSQCKLLFPTDTTLLIYHISIMFAILIIGSIIHFIILPQCPCHANKKQTNINKGTGIRGNRTTHLAAANQYDNSMNKSIDWSPQKTEAAI
eukprot:113369_1